MMVRPITNLRNHPGLAILALFLCALYVYFFAFRSVVSLDFSPDAPLPGMFKIYWAGEGEGYSEGRMNQVLVTGQRRNYRMYLGSLGDIARVRIDPMEYQGSAKLRRVEFVQPGFQHVVLDSPQSLTAIAPVQQALPLSITEDHAIMVTTGGDGQFELEIAAQTGPFPIVHIVNIVLIFVLVVVLGRALMPLFRDDLYVPWCLLVALLLAIIMASITGPDVHPDESAHYAAVHYFSGHLLPPPIDSGLAEGSFSVYGYSRLANLEMYYPLAGYLTWMLSPLNLPDLFATRVFGLLLLLVLTALAFFNQRFRIFAVPLLISAQTWYLFSYTASEGFAIFLSIVAAWQVADEESAFNRLLTQPAPTRKWLWVGGFGLLFGLLLLAKTNFYFFILFLGVVLLWRVLRGDFNDQRQLWSRIAVIGLVALSFYGGRIAINYAVNGPDPGTRYAAVIEQQALPAYKPSTPLEQQHVHLYLKERGVTLDQVIHKEKWLGKTLLSAFGAYGFTQYFGSQDFYRMTAYGGALLLMLFLYGILVNGRSDIQVLFLAGAVCTLALVGMLLWRSWAISFQPQGRYLAPVLPILGVIYYYARPYVFDKAVMLLTVFLFLLGVYSFVFIGLHDIWKAPFEF